MKISSSLCWIWNGQKDRDGYAKCYWKGKTHIASRVSYELWNGHVVPKGKEIHHVCEKRACINPHHLKAITHLKNVRVYMDKIIQCPKKHPYNAANTGYHYKGKYRSKFCRICSRAANRKQYWNKKKGIYEKGLNDSI